MNLFGDNMNFIDEVQLEDSIKKLVMYKNNIDLSFDEVKIVLGKMNDTFETGNKKVFLELTDDLVQKKRIVTKIHNDNLYVLEKNLDNYRRTAKEVSHIFNNIEEKTKGL